MRRLFALAVLIVWTRWSLVLAILSLSIAPAIRAQTQPVTLQLLTPSQTDLNNRIGAVAAFSVASVPDQYRVYGTTWIQRNRWVTGSDSFRDYFWESQFIAAIRDEPDGCYVKKDPRVWNRRCVDAIGVVTTRHTCNPSIPDYACQNNDFWNAYPGRSNMSTFPVRPAPDDSGFGWPSNLSWGVKNYRPILDKNTVNAVQLNPPSSGLVSKCHPSNPSEFATGTQNAKVAQVRYPSGATRWFMAYNNQVHYEFANSGFNGQDLWRVQWAYSDDGFNWTPESRPLFLDVTERSGSCDQGLYVVDMFVDNGYFYIVGNRVYLDHLWLIRSKIDFNSTSGPGYDPFTWEVRGTFDSGTGKYRWAPIPSQMLGSVVDFTAIGGEPILPTRFGLGHYGGALKHTIISRVFTSSTPNSPSQYVALTVDQNLTAPPSRPIVELWTTNSLDRPFVYQSDVSNMPYGGYGFEMSFVRYVDNTPATPRVFDDTFELWISHPAACEGIPKCCADVPENCPAGTTPAPDSRVSSNFTVSRRRARLSGGIFGN
jgi:hypothetical protein